MEQNYIIKKFQCQKNLSKYKNSAMFRNHNIATILLCVNKLYKISVELFVNEKENILEYNDKRINIHDKEIAHHFTRLNLLDDIDRFVDSQGINDITFELNNEFNVEVSIKNKKEEVWYDVDYIDFQISELNQEELKNKLIEIAFDHLRMYNELVLTENCS